MSKTRKLLIAAGGLGATLVAIPMLYYGTPLPCHMLEEEMVRRIVATEAREIDPGGGWEFLGLTLAAATVRANPGALTARDTTAECVEKLWKVRNMSDAQMARFVERLRLGAS